MKEFWINVYHVGYIWYGPRWWSRKLANDNVGLLRDRLLYRIHVRLK